MKVSALMCVWNCVEFVEYAIRGIIDKVDELIVVEGSWNLDNPSASTDGTLDAIARARKDYPNKIQFVPYIPTPPEEYPYYVNEEHKKNVFKNHNAESCLYKPTRLAQQQLGRQSGLRKILENFQEDHWLFLIDADEFYPDSIKKISDLINGCLSKKPDATLLVPQSYNFYFDPKTYVLERFNRIFKLRSGSWFVDSNTIAHSMDYRFNVPPEVCRFFHYSYVGSSDRIRFKLDRWDDKIVNDWMTDVYNEKDMLQRLINNEGGIHLLGRIHPQYRHYFPRKYEGEHPFWAKKALENLKS